MKNKSRFGRFTYWMSFGILICMMAACSGESGYDAPSSGEAATSEVSFNFKLNALTEETEEIQAKEMDGEQTFTGKLTVKNSDMKEIGKYNWYAEIGKNKETNLPTAISDSYIALAPGTYFVTLRLKKGELIYKSQNDVPITVRDEDITTGEITIHPVIKTASGTTGTIEDSAEIDFSYAATAISGMKLKDPKLVVWVKDDSGKLVKTIIDLDPKNDNTTAMLSFDVAGERKIQLELLEGGIQIGKSIPEQEMVFIGPDEYIRMDLAPLHGGVDVTLPIGGSKATFKIDVPERIIEEAGGLENLRAELVYNNHSVDGQKGRVEARIKKMSGPVVQYKGIASIENFNYGTVSLTFKFYDTKGTIEPEDDKKIAWAWVNNKVNGISSAIELDSNVESFEFQFKINRKTLGTGSLVGLVNVCATKDFAFVAQASVFANGEFIGMTGDGTGTDTNGCYEHYIIPDKNVKFSVQMREGSNIYKGKAAAFTIEPLNVYNVDIRIKDQALKAPSDILNFDGVDDHVTIETLGGALEGTHTYTLELKLKAAAPPIAGPSTLFSHCNENASECTALLQLDDEPGVNGKRRFKIQVGETKGSVTLNNWNKGATYLVSMVYNGNQPQPLDRVIFYLNGKEKTIDVAVDEPDFPEITPSTHMEVVTLGVSVLNNGGGVSLVDPFQGDMDEVRIWRDVRTQKEIRKNKKQLQSVGAGDMVSFYEFNNGDAGGVVNSNRKRLKDTVGTHKGILKNFGLTGNTSNWL